MIALLSGWSPYRLDPLLVGAALDSVSLLVTAFLALVLLLVVAYSTSVLLLVGVFLAFASDLVQVGSSLSSVSSFSFFLCLALLAAVLLVNSVFLVLIVEQPALSKSLTIAKGASSDTMNYFTVFVNL